MDASAGTDDVGRPKEPGVRGVPTGDRRVIVRAIGTADAGIVATLSQGLGLTSNDVVRAVYRAPGVLLDRVERGFAERLAKILGEAGLEVEVVSADTPVPTSDEVDVAFHLREPGRLREVAMELSRFSNVALAQATQMLVVSPAMVLGGVSPATVEAIQRRFGPLDVEVAASPRPTARYDLVLLSDDPGARSGVTEVLRRLGVAVFEGGPMLAIELDLRTAERVWRAVSQREHIRLVNRAFERFDVWVLGMPKGADAAAGQAALVAQTGMPVEIAAKLAEHLPLVLHEAVGPDDAARHLAALAEAGVDAEARLVTFQAFDLMVRKVSDAEAAARVLASLLGQDVDAMRREVRRLPARLVGPYTHPRARWLEAELRAVGAVASLEAR